MTWHYLVIIPSVCTVKRSHGLLLRSVHCWVLLTLTLTMIMTNSSPNMRRLALVATLIWKQHTYMYMHVPPHTHTHTHTQESVQSNIEQKEGKGKEAKRDVTIECESFEIFGNRQRYNTFITHDCHPSFYHIHTKPHHITSHRIDSPSPLRRADFLVYHSMDFSKSITKRISNIW